MFGKLLILWWVEKVKGVRVVVVVVEIVLVFVLLMLVLRWQCKEAIYNLSAGGFLLMLHGHRLVYHILAPDATRGSFSRLRAASSHA